MNLCMYRRALGEAICATSTVARDQVPCITRAPPSSVASTILAITARRSIGDIQRETNTRTDDTIGTLGAS